MPTVPTYDDFHATPSAGGVTPAQEGYNAEAATGSDLQQLGQGMSSAGSDFAKVALDQQNIQNQIRVNDAVNQARVATQNLTFDPQVGYQSQKGLNALQRDSGMALPEEYGQKLSSQLSDIASTLTPAQQRLFQPTAANIATQFNGDVEQHMMQQAQVYRVGVNDATIDLAANDAETYWNDPDKINAAKQAMQAATVDKYRALGMEGAPTDAALLTQTSKVHTAVVMAALENNNPNYALGYLAQNRGEMTAGDILKVQGQVNQQVWATQAMQAVQGTTQAFQPKIAPTDFDRMTQITMASESGGQRFAPNGNLLTSAKGAQGEMQVMPGTATDPGFGVRPAQDNSPGELARVGRDYLQAMVQRYGDPAKAWAAYNAGPGAVDAAMKSNPTNWLAAMPAETQAYVQKNVSALGATPPRPVEADFVNDALSRLPPGAAPQVVKMVREQAVTQFGMLNKSLSEQGDNAVRAGQQWIVQNPGTPVAQMPPSLAAPITQYAPDKFIELDKLSKSLQRGDVVTNLPLYSALASNPDELAKLSDTQFTSLQSQLAPVDFKHFANERANIQNGTTDDTSGGINTKALNQSLNTRLESLQIPTSPKPTDLAGRERLGGIQQYVRDSVFQAQQQLGRKMNPEELDQQVDGLFAQNATFKDTFLGIPYGGTTTKPLLAAQFNDIPSDTAGQIRQRLITEGIAAPTNNQILNRFRAVKAANGGQ